MRKSIISLTLCMLMGGVSILAQTNSADFETMGDKADTNYSTRTSTAGWTAKNAALVSIDNTVAPTLNGKTSAVGEIKSPLLTDGINSLSFNYTNTFSESKGVKLEVRILNNENILVEKKTLENASVTTKEIYTFTYEDIAWEGEFYIEIKNLCPSNSTKNKDRVSIWNLTWESYSENAPVLAPANLAFAQDAYEVDINDTNTIDLGLTKDTDAPVVYTSSNEAFTVDENGIVSFTAMGTTTITATTAATDAFKAGSATCSVTVNDRTALLDEITTGFFEGFTGSSYTAYDASSTYADYYIVASNNKGKIQWNRGNEKGGANSGLAVNTKEGYHPVKFIIETSASVDIFTSEEPYTSPAEATENPVETLAKGENTYILADGVRNFAIRPTGTGSMSVTKLVILYEADEEVAAPELPTIEFEGFDPEVSSYMLGDFENSVTINLSHADADIWHKFVKADAPLQAAETEADDRDGFNLHDGAPITITEPGILHVYAEKNGKRSETKTIEFVDGSSSITDIEAAGNDAPAEYFNLQGIRIDNPAAGSVVIRRQGNDIRKIVVR